MIGNDRTEFARTMVAQSPTATLLVDGGGLEIAANSAFRSLMAASTLSGNRHNWTDIIDPADIGSLSRAIENAHATTASWKGTIRLDPSLVRVTAHHVLVTPVPDGGAAIVQFVETLALTDDLTGLPNRVDLLERLDGALDEAHRAGRQVGVLFLDLDRFKVVNDSLGHRAGDDILREVAMRIRKTIRPEDLVARLGGDEFVVLVHRVGSRDDLTTAAERIRRNISTPIELEDGRIIIITSIGIAIADGSQSAEELIRDADTALYRAKDLGRDRASVFDDLLRARAIARHSTEQRLRQCLDDSSIEVRYQPTVDIATGTLTGVEALVRMRDDDEELLLPPDFLDVAEETGLVRRLGTTVLDQALHDLKDWNQRATTPMTVAINVSPRQLNDQRFPAIVASALSNCEIDPSLLLLEITEHVLIEASPLTERVLFELSELGVGLGLDDFGTGYSSLAYLKRYPMTFVKIDQSFVAGLGQDDDDTAIVRATIALAQSLNLRVLAEGVEDEAQLAQLRELGCDMAQGYLFSRPVTGSVIEGLLDHRWVAAGKSARWQR